MGLGHILGDFVTNSSGHPGVRPRFDILNIFHALTSTRRQQEFF
jgi:hypothetical protein